MKVVHVVLYVVDFHGVNLCHNVNCCYGNLCYGKWHVTRNELSRTILRQEILGC